MIKKSQYKSLKEWRNTNIKDYNIAVSRGWLNDICEIFGWTPRNYWTKERCADEARKYKTRTEWRDNSNTSYRTAIRNGWMDECCEHMLMFRKPHGYWTKEMCADEARKYKTRTEWGKNCKSSRHAARKNGWIDECTSHMKKQKQKPTGFWNNKENVLAEAKKCKSLKEWRDNSNASYGVARKKGWLDECCEHMIITRKPNGYWKIKENVLASARKYKRRSEWAKNCNSSRHAAIKYGWLDECCEHMEKLFRWSKEGCIIEARKHEKIVDWKINGRAASYAVARQNGWLDECTSHMKNRNKNVK